MIAFNVVIKKYANQGEKTGWTYIEIPAAIAEQLKPGNKKAFRVKGLLDNCAFEMISLVPVGDGLFILALNAGIRKKIAKKAGAVLSVKMEADERELQAPAEFIECLAEDDQARTAYNKLNKSHQHYFGNWIAGAKTAETKARRIAQALNALSAGLQYGEMMRKIQKDRKDLLH